MKKKSTIKKHTITATTTVTQPVDVRTPLVESSGVKFKNSQGVSYEFSDQEEYHYYYSGVGADPRTSEEEEDEIIQDDVIIITDAQDVVGKDGFKDGQAVIVQEAIHNDTTNSDLFKRLGASAVIATGTGVAMMPIFNYLVKHSKDLGVDIHENHALFAISTANTFAVTFCSSFSSAYHFIKRAQESRHESDSAVIMLSKMGANFSIVLPISLLWGIELNNQKVSGSSGFDPFVAWATFSTIPLMINHSIDIMRATDNLFNSSRIPLENFGSKLAVYGLSTLAIAGRAIAYTQAIANLAKIIGIDSDIAFGVGVAAGGVFGASGIGLFEYQAMRSLFAKEDEPMTLAKLAGGLGTAVEGAWFSLPILSLGLEATEGWNPLLRGVLFTPVAISSTLYSATKLYDNIANAYDTVCAGVTSICSSDNEYYE
jgi:hypothetical protein